MTGLSRGNERKVGGGASERSENRERERATVARIFSIPAFLGKANALSSPLFRAITCMIFPPMDTCYS